MFFRLCWVFVAALGLSPFSSFGGQGLLSSCSAQASHWGGTSCCKAWALGAPASVDATEVLLSGGSQALEHAAFSSCSSQLQSTGSVAVAHGLGPSAARGIFPDQGSTCIVRWILIHRATGEVRICDIFIKVQAL